MAELTAEIELKDTVNWLKVFHDDNLIVLTHLEKEQKISVSIMGGPLVQELKLENFKVIDNRTEVKDVSE